MKKWFIIPILIFVCQIGTSAQNVITSNKPTICIIGGTPSTANILMSLPDSLKTKYNLISFNRPGYGGTQNHIMSDELLFKLARKAGLRDNDYGVIGISGGGPLAILLASKFNLKHCGVVSGMVSRDAFFAFADSAVTKDLMESVINGKDSFSQTIRKFPHLDEILKQAESTNQETAIVASYDDLHYILSDALYKSIKNKNLKIDWWHGEKDNNVPFRSAEYFLKDYKNAKLNIIPDATHGIDSRIYVGQIIQQWKN
ncbi:MAG: hypothetical protein ABJA70_23500 [Chryseolinea sp.]